MKRLYTATLFLPALFALILLAGCKNPLSEEKNKKLVHQETFYEMGRYDYFWNGRDLDNRYVTPGKYYILLEVRDFQDQDYVTAIDGGKAVDLESGYYYYNEIWRSNELGKIEPNPFPVKEGCTITFIISGEATAKLSIYQD
jgi:hypothetical protein